MVTLKNSKLEVKINPYGAEVQSVKDGAGHEYMWCGDPAIWGRTAPVVFPVCGSLKDGAFFYKGKSYSLEKHGFARFLDYTVEKAEPDKAIFKATGLEKYRESYPFDYDFYIIYTITENRLSVTYRVVNRSDEPMYFSVGSHEGYACPGGIENYDIVFEKEECLRTLLLDGSLLSGESEQVAENVKTLPLKYEYFEKDSLIFEGIKSRSLSLTDRRDKRSITVSFPETDSLVLWTIPRNEYICIEPWNGLPDRSDASGKIDEKHAIITLSGNEQKEIGHEIIFG